MADPGKIKVDRTDPSVVESGPDQEPGQTGLLSLADLVEVADSSPQEPLDLRTQDFLWTETSSRSHPIQVEPDDPPDSRVDRPTDQLGDLGGSPGLEGLDHRLPLLEVETEDQAIGPELRENLGQVVEATQGLQTNDPPVDAGIDQAGEILGGFDAGIDPDGQSQPDEFSIKREDGTSLSQDRIEVGQIEVGEPPEVESSSGQNDRVGTLVQDAPERPIMGSSTANGVDSLTLKDVEDGDQTHRGARRLATIVRKIRVFEYVTGGGMIGFDLPESWVREGSAIRRAIASDFAAVPGVEVSMGLDPGIVEPAIEGVRIGSENSPDDQTVLIAPETGGVLAEVTRLSERSMGSAPEAIDLVTDKARLADHFEAREIATPRTRVFDTSAGLPIDLEGPVVVKPIDGAGSLDTFVVLEGRSPSRLGANRRMLAQPYLPGRSMSASFLVDRQSKVWLIAVGRQSIAVDPRGRISYRGGTVPATTSVDLAEIVRAVDSVTGLRGFVGVDFLDDGKGHAVILEINPRPTTSYVGLSRIMGLGTIAGAWARGNGRWARIDRLARSVRRWS